MHSLILHRRFVVIYVHVHVCARGRTCLPVKTDKIPKFISLVLSLSLFLSLFSLYRLSS